MNFLRDYQYDAVSKMTNGCILNGDVGSGKSRTGLYYYFSKCGGKFIDEYIPMTDPIDLYIITTARKRDTLEWDLELTNYLLSQRKEDCEYDITIVVDSWNNIKKYENIKDSFFIFDEDRVVGNGSWVKSFLKITKSNQWVILSATPGDTWIDYIPVFIANGFYDNRTQFIREHVIYSRYSRFPKIDKYLNTGRLIRLRDKILINMDFERQTTSHHETVWVEFDRIKYKQARVDRYDYIQDVPLDNATALCNCLRRIANSHPSRIEAAWRIANDKKKVIIFYNFNYELDILKEKFCNTEFDVAEWNGHAHQEIPSSEKWVYLVQYLAGCEGWNCITTDTIIFYSESYSYRTMAQAAGRIDRMNTPFIDLFYYHLKSHADIDMAISKALSMKKDFNKRKFFGKFV